MTDYAYFCSLLYNSTFMPMHYYQNETLVQVYPFKQFPTALLDTFRGQLLGHGKDIAYITTKNFLYIGLVQNKATGEQFFIGPISSTPIPARVIGEIMNEASVSLSEKEIVTEYFHATPLFTFYQFLNILTLLNREINQTNLDIYETFHINNSEKSKEISKKHSNDLYERKEQEQYHNTYLFEQEYYGYVETGDVDGLQRFTQNIPSLTAGNMADNSLRQAKNIFISSVTMITRKSIAGGLDIETAYQLSDAYIQEAEKMSDRDEIDLLNLTAVFDFTRRVKETKIPTDMSPDIYKAIQFISNHTNQQISVVDVAEHLNMDRSSLSKKFKKELGFNISDFIMRRKLEEAKSLLHFTDKSISEISEYLCFSTQSYFQNVFKKKYGITPNEFRKQI